MTESMKIDPSQLTDLLWEDTAGTVRDAAVARLGELRDGLKRKLDAGVTPAEFAALSKVHASLDTAQRVVNDIWMLMQRINETQDT